MMAATVLIVPVRSSFANENINLEDTIQNESTETDGTVNQEDLSTQILSETDVVLRNTEYMYTAEEITPSVIVKHNGQVLTLNEDYEIVDYINNINVGTATVVVKGINGYTGKIEKDFDILPLDFSEAKISLNQIDWTYTGYPIKPSVKVTYQGETLSRDDYTIKYSNNVYPGTAKATITGKGHFSNVSITKNFYISRITSLKNISRGVNSVKLTWSYKKNVTGYIIYKKTSSGNYKWVKTVKGSRNNVCTVGNLSSRTVQTFKVRAYVKKNGTVYYGRYILLTTFTKPGRVTMERVSTSPRLMVYVKWKKKNCSGYQVRLSRHSNFSNAATYKVSSPYTLQKTIKQLRNNKTYYVKVRAYKKYGDAVSYGAWSKYKKFKSYNNGWMTINGKKCYVRDGKVVYGYTKIGGNPYYFDRTTGEWRGVSYKMWSKVKNEPSGTKWLIAVSKSSHRVCVYYGSKGKWKLKKYWKCTTGAKGTPTPSGKFSVPKTNTYQYTFGRKDGYSVWYTTRIYKGYLFHSVLYTPGSKANFFDGRLGYSLSHGCVRLALPNAKWIQDNIRPGTKVIIY